MKMTTEFVVEVANGSDPTFRSYKGNQASEYNKGRPAYAQELYRDILKYHDNAGLRGIVVDVGCGPGRATREIGRFFDQAIGIDPSENMIETARRVGGTTQANKPIKYHVSAAEKIASLDDVPLGDIDLITAATAVHWFDMSEFWDQAAQLLKPGGTVALWTTGCFYAHPLSENAAELNRIMHRLECDELARFEVARNILSRTLYHDLTLPWQLSQPHPAFKEVEYVRHEWDRDGVLSDGDDFYGGSLVISLETLERGYDTSSTVTRWREANPKLAYGPNDCVKRTISQLREAAGLEAKGTIRGSTSTALLLFKRR